MSYSKEQELIKQLHHAGVINSEELKKAELYLSFATKTPNTYEEALEWLIQNRAISRDRQDEVKTAFSAAQARLASLSNDQRSSEKTDGPEASSDQERSSALNAQPEPNDEQERNTDPTSWRDGYRPVSDSAEAVLADIYRFNVEQLTALAAEGKITAKLQKITEEKLRNCAYLFYGAQELAHWIKSNYQSPIDPGCSTLDRQTLLTLYRLLKQNAISREEYHQGYDSLIEYNANRLPKVQFEYENSLFNWLVSQGELDHDIKDIYQARQYNSNLELLNELIAHNRVDASRYQDIANALEQQKWPTFDNEQRLLQWISDQGLQTAQAAPATPTSIKPAKKKKRPPLLFIALMIYVLYRIFSGVIGDSKAPSRSSSSTVRLVQPTPEVSAAVNCNDGRYIGILLRKALLSENVNHLGMLKAISNPHNVSLDTCGARAEFQSGSARVTFKVSVGKDGKSVDLTRINYTDIQVKDTQDISTPEASRNNYEALIVQTLQQMDRLIKQRRADAPGYLDIISSVKPAGQCQRGNDSVITCPFIVHYKDVWTHSDFTGNFTLNVQFTYENNALALYAVNQFIKALTDGLSDDFQRQNAGQQ